MSISAYKGEFTLSPIPLEFSGNYCSHACSYCFANLNNPNRSLDSKSVINKIKNQNTSKSLEAVLLREGYPILMSNKVDPFSTTNYRQTIAFAEMFIKNGNRIAWQTRGGEGIDEILSMGQKDCWYISMPIVNEETRKKIEPGTQTISKRWELIEKLIEKGQSVTLGLNPTCPEFITFDEASDLMIRSKKIGVKGVWLSAFHLNNKQIGNMSKKEYSALDELGLLEYSKKRSVMNKSNAYALDLADIAESIGLDPFYAGYGKKSLFFEDYYNLYPKNFRNTQGLINYLYDNYPYGIELHFEDYYEWFVEPFMENININGLDGYIYNIARNLYKKLNIGKDVIITSYKDVLRCFWNYGEIWHNPAGFKCFAKIGDKKEQIKDENGNYIYKFVPLK